MSGPSKAGEPSMEEILASIRKIIADDPSKEAPEAPTLTAKPSTPATSFSPTLGESKPSEPLVAKPVVDSAPAARPSPSFGRLSEALRTTFASTDGPSSSNLSSSSGFSGFGSTTPTLPLGSATARDQTPPKSAPEAPTIAVFNASQERSRSIDNELDDLLNEPLTSSQTPVLNDAGQTSGSGGQWAVWRTSSSKGADNKGLDINKPADDSVSAKAPDSASAPAVPGALPPPSLGRASGGFYPSASAPPSAPAKPSSSPFATSPRFEPSLSRPLDAAPASGFEALSSKRSEDATSVKAAQPSLGDSAPAAGSPKPFGEAAGPSLDARPAAKPGPVVIAAMPSAAKPPAAPVVTAPPEAPKPEAANVLPPAAEPPAAAPPSSISVPLPPRTALFSRPFSVTQREPAPAASVIPPSDRLRATGAPVAPPSPLASVAPHAGVPTESDGRRPASAVPAPSSPLDALAVGLAASNVGVPVAPAPVTPATSSAETAPSAAAPRTLEDMVADMVKPMLQKWLTDNMPRIIEKALRSEAGLGPKPPGT